LRYSAKKIKGNTLCCFCLLALFFKKSTDRLSPGAVETPLFLESLERKRGERYLFLEFRRSEGKKKNFCSFSDADNFLLWPREML